MRERAIELDEDPSNIKANIPPDEVPVHPSKKGKGGDNKRSKGEHLDSIENKRARLGGPACMPESWRNRDPSSMIMSFDMPVREDGSTIIFFQATSQLPAFGRYTLECSEQERIHRVLELLKIYGLHKQPLHGMFALEMANVSLKQQRNMASVLFVRVPRPPS